MKPNEAPKRIYLFENPIDNTPDDRWLSKRYCKDDIEYTRTDAFIEKAVEWLENHNDYIGVKDGNVTYFDMEKCVKDFRKAMNGGEK